METKATFDPFDPVATAWRRFRHKIRNIAILCGALVLIVFLFGAPAIQWNYKHNSTQGVPNAMDKIRAEYWTPMFPWKIQTVKAGELAPGCPWFVFIPLSKCMEEVTTKSDRIQLKSY